VIENSELKVYVRLTRTADRMGAVVTATDKHLDSSDLEYSLFFFFIEIFR